MIPEPGEVHAWFADLALPPETLNQMRLTLAADERERAARFYFDRDRDRYVAARGILRRLLARYLDTTPERIAFLYGEHGKPALAAPWESSGLRFNVSHSHGSALYAFAAGREIGCDIEQHRENVLADRIAERFFSPSEVSALDSLPAGQRMEGFFNCWTRKEAWIKARSQGLSIPLDSFDVTLAPGEPAILLATRPDPDEAARWTLHALDAPPGFAAAIAVEGRPDRVRVHNWPGDFT